MVPFIPIVTASYPPPPPSSPGYEDGEALRSQLDTAGGAATPPFYLQFDDVASDFFEVDHACRRDSPALPIPRAVAAAPNSKSRTPRAHPAIDSSLLLADGLSSPNP